METKRLGAIETRFAELIWANAPLSSPELVKRSAEALGWKKSTTYTVLKKHCERGLFKNEDAIVQVVKTRADYDREQSTQFVEETFSGSLPAFLAAFTSGKPLTAQEAEEIRQMIDAFRGEK